MPLFLLDSSALLIQWELVFCLAVYLVYTTTSVPTVVKCVATAKYVNVLVTDLSAAKKRLCRVVCPHKILSTISQKKVLHLPKEQGHEKKCSLHAVCMQSHERFFSLKHAVTTEKDLRPAEYSRGPGVRSHPSTVL